MLWLKVVLKLFYLTNKLLSPNVSQLVFICIVGVADWELQNVLLQIKIFHMILLKIQPTAPVTVLKSFNYNQSNSQYVPTGSPAWQQSCEFKICV